MGIRSTLLSIAADAVRPDSLLGAGSEAPSFELESDAGGRVSSDELRGDQHALLVFYPSDGSAMAGRLLAAFEGRRDRFAAERCRLLGIGPGSAGQHRRFGERLGLGFPLLVDAGRRTAVAYQTARPGVPATFASVFLIDDRGIVRMAMKGEPSPDAILAAVERLNQTGFKGTGRRGRRLVPQLSGSALRQQLEDDGPPLVLDVREAADWRAGHIPGAINLPIDALRKRLADLPDHDTAIVVTCDQGLRAPGAARILRDAGWKRLHTLSDGMIAWKGELERVTER
jgi:peroxiredoxin/rhodanese-related sulfurtransferase